MISNESERQQTQTETIKVGSYPLTTESYLLSFQGKVTFPTLFNYLIHAASLHAAEHGFGFKEMTDKETAWVLSRIAIEMDTYPGLAEEIIIHTWVDEVNKFFTCRNFEIQNAKGESIGLARSIWAAIDMQTRKPSLLDVDQLTPYLEDRPCPISKPGKIKPIEATTEGTPYRVKYSDLDVNKHLNSAKYIEHLLDLYPIEKFEKQDIQRFEIMYIAEGMYDMQLHLHRAEEDPQTDILAVCNDGKAICRAKIRWK